VAYLNSRPRTPKICPVCGEDVPPRALACPECGADHNSGWKPDAYDGGPDFEEQEFDYDEFVKKEFGPERSPVNQLWWITGVVLLLAFAAWIVVEAMR